MELAGEAWSGGGGRQTDRQANRKADRQAWNLYEAVNTSMALSWYRLAGARVFPK